MRRPRPGFNELTQLGLIVWLLHRTSVSTTCQRWCFCRTAPTGGDRRHAETQTVTDSVCKPATVWGHSSHRGLFIQEENVSKLQKSFHNQVSRMCRCLSEPADWKSGSVNTEVSSYQTDDFLKVTRLLTLPQDWSCTDTFTHTFKLNSYFKHMFTHKLYIITSLTVITIIYSLILISFLSFKKVISVLFLKFLMLHQLICCLSFIEHIILLLLL